MLLSCPPVLVAVLEVAGVAPRLRGAVRAGGVEGAGGEVADFVFGVCEGFPKGLLDALVAEGDVSAECNDGVHSDFDVAVLNHGEDSVNSIGN